MATIRTYKAELYSHLLVVLEVLATKAISYPWASVRGFYSYLASRSNYDALIRIALLIYARWHLIISSIQTYAPQTVSLSVISFTPYNFSISFHC